MSSSIALLLATDATRRNLVEPQAESPARSRLAQALVDTARRLDPQVVAPRVAARA